MREMSRVPVKKAPVLMSIPDFLARTWGLDPKHGPAIHDALVLWLRLTPQHGRGVKVQDVI